MISILQPLVPPTMGVPSAVTMLIRVWAFSKNLDGISPFRNKSGIRLPVSTSTEADVEKSPTRISASMTSSTVRKNTAGSGELNSSSQLCQAGLSTDNKIPGFTWGTMDLAFVRFPLTGGPIGPTGHVSTTVSEKERKREMGKGNSRALCSESHLSSAHGSVPKDPGLSHSCSDSLA